MNGDQKQTLGVAMTISLLRMIAASGLVFFSAIIGVFVLFKLPKVGNVIMVPIGVGIILGFVTLGIQGAYLILNSPQKQTVRRRCFR